MPMPGYEIFESLKPFKIHSKTKAKTCRMLHEFEVQISSIRKRFLRVLFIKEKVILLIEILSFQSIYTFKQIVININDIFLTFL